MLRTPAVADSSNMTKLYSAAPEAVRCGVRSEAESERSGDGAERCGVRSGGINNGAWN